MTREELCSKLCYSDYTNDCSACDGNYNCDDCQAMINPLLDAYEQTIRARVLEELFNLNCKDISQDECDAYCSNCYHCQFDRIKKKAEQL